MNGFLIFSIILYLVSFFSSIAVVIIDLRLSKKILKREGEFNSKINFLNSACQSNKDSIESLKSKVFDLEKILEKINSRLNEVEAKQNKAPTVKVNKTSNKDNNKVSKPVNIKKKVVQKKVVKNNNESTDSDVTAGPVETDVKENITD